MEKLALLGGRPILKKPFPPYRSLGREEEKAVLRVMKGGVLSGFIGQAGEGFNGGKYVRKLEQAFQKRFQVKQAISFNSASTALQAAVGALGIGPGDQVITSPATMTASASAILFNNALPVFADIEEDYFCLSARSIKKKITPKTKAILVVNLCGGSADYRPILRLARQYGLKIIEDNAQSAGATYRKKYTGTIGDIGVFSFNVHKTMHCGEGGVLVTNNDHYAFRARLIRNHGEAVIDDLCRAEKKYEPILGNNFRLTELQAAIAIEQLKKIDVLNRSRIGLAQYLSEKLKQFDWLIPAKIMEKSVHVFYIYPFRFLEKKIGIGKQIFARAMVAEGFFVNENYGRPLYFYPLYQKQRIYPHSRFPFVSREYPQNVSYRYGICPTAERLYEKELLITNICQPPQRAKDIDLFIAAVKKIECCIEQLKVYEKKN